MKVILSVDVQGHGKKGDVVTVNDGYARNFLLPKKMAVEATKAILIQHQQMLDKAARIAEEQKQEALALGKKISGATIVVHVRCGDGKMYGSVTTQDISDALKSEGYVVDKKKITIKDPIKSPGVYEVSVKVYKETVVKIKVSVVGDKA
ncbi:MAG: 50S ribosomal protein L9 [Bacillota bacterium]